MAETTLLYSAFFSLVTGALYHFVGAKVGRKDLAGDDRTAMMHFKMWWHGFGLLSVSTAAISALAYAGRLTLAIYEVFLDAVLFVLFLALWGLAYYLAYLFTGNRRWMVATAVFYALFYLYVAYAITLADPAALEIGRWSVTIQYANQAAMETTGLRYLALLLLLPQVLGAIGYGSLFFRTDAPLARYRIAMVSLTLLAWFGSSITASALDINETEAWSLASRVISVAAALLILIAFHPPSFVRRRLEAAPAAA